MKQLLVVICLFFYTQEGYYNNRNDYFKFNTCEFGKFKKNITKIRGVSIIKYSIVNNPNKKKDTLSEYFLVKISKDTFNVIQIFNYSSTDSFIKKSRWSDNWIFNPMRDTCIYFHSQINLKQEINPKYPVLFGQIYAELD